MVIADEPLAPRRYDIEPRRSPWGWMFLGVILLGAGAVYLKPDLLDRAKQMIPAEWLAVGEQILTGTPQEPVEEIVAQPQEETPVASAPIKEPAIEEPVTNEPAAEQPAADAPVAAEPVAGDPVDEGTVTDTSVAEEPIDDVPLADDSVTDEVPAETVEEATVDETPAEPEIDETRLLPADVTVGLVATGQFVPEIEVTLREDSDDVTIDLVRMHDMRESLTVLLEEVGFSGNRSPWEEGQYLIANNGIATFEAGKNRVRTRLSMSTDSIREADRNVTIQVREIDNAEAEFARINLTLEDDDRRAYEASLPMNTVAFGTGEIFVSEADPAVQIDVIRFKPSSTALEVSYVVNDLTTTAGKDYFPPGDPTIYFSPNQRSARILIPLVQDADLEESEVFAIEFLNPARQLDPEIYQSVAIMIRDDD